MKILLINPAIRLRCPPDAFPVGLGIIANIMVSQGHKVVVYDENVLRRSNTDTLCDLSRIKDVDVVGIGGLITTYSRIKNLMPHLKEIFPRAKFILGGGVTVEPEVVFENMAVDFCVNGEGEHTFQELCLAINNKEDDFSKIAGISYIDKAKDCIINTRARPLERNLDQFPRPAYELFPMESYLDNLARHLNCGAKRCVNILWSRGCPNQCTFCWRMFEGGARFRSTNLVMDEIAFLRSNYRVDSYLFVDETINANRKKSLEFVTQLIEKGYAAPWYSHARVDNFDEELAQAFSRSGCFGLNFGIESGSAEMLANMKKHLRPAQATKAMAIAKKANIKQICTFIVGMPGETKATVKMSLDWIHRNRVSYSNFFVATPYPKSELYLQPFVQELILKKYGSKDAFFSILDDADKPYVNMTNLTDNELTELIHWAAQESNRRNGNWLENAAVFLKKFFLLLIQPYRWKRVLVNRIYPLFLSKDKCTETSAVLEVKPLLRRLETGNEPAFNISDRQQTTINRFMHKVKTGDYLLSENPCLCGSDDSLLIARKDRYGIAVDTQLCRRCGLMRTDPYLTRDSLSRFYAEEYYDIYLGETELEDFLLDQKKRAARLIRWLNDYRINGYKSVFEVGCGPGGILEVFRSKGLYVAGCDYQLKFLSYGQRMNLNVTYGDAKSLHSFGKTDLLILSHVLEHFRDPVAEVKQMHTLLNNGGLIFIEVPGIFSINRTYGDLLLFLQNAHAWHFCLDTLDFIMARAGFTRIAGDELVRAVYKIAPEGFVVREKPYIHRRIVNYFLRAELNRNIKHLLQIPIHSKNAILNSEKN